MGVFVFWSSSSLLSRLRYAHAAQHGTGMIDVLYAASETQDGRFQIVCFSSLQKFGTKKHKKEKGCQRARKRKQDECPHKLVVHSVFMQSTVEGNALRVEVGGGVKSGQNNQLSYLTKTKKGLRSHRKGTTYVPVWLSLT